jgi:hypothetical protein
MLETRSHGMNGVSLLEDGLVHAIKEGCVEGVEVLLLWEEKNYKTGQPFVSTNAQANSQ